MQSKGFIRVITVLLVLVCLFYLSFSFVTNSVENDAAASAAKFAATEAAKIKRTKHQMPTATLTTQSMTERMPATSRMLGRKRCTCGTHTIKFAKNKLVWVLT